MVKKNILGTIGTTPMVRINRLCPNPNVKIFAKLEGFNPTGSIKDRIALRMIEAAERDGRLTPGKTIIEPTSGNTGIGLAIVGIVKGYPVEIVMSSAVSVERRKIIRSYGAKVILTPAEEGTDGAIRLARSKVAGDPDKYFMPDQFANAGNYLAHYQSTALEIWQQTGGRIDYLVCAIGTSGTLMGLSRFLKVMKPDIRVVCAQPIRYADRLGCRLHLKKRDFVLADNRLPSGIKPLFDLIMSIKSHRKKQTGIEKKADSF